MRTETNTCLENVSNNNKDQLKLRDFNDLKKEDVITTVQRVVAKKEIYAQIEASPYADDLHYTLSKDEAEKIESEYKDKDSQKNQHLFSMLDENADDALRDEITTTRHYEEDDVQTETEIEEISVDHLARRKFAFYSTKDLADDLIDHSKVDEKNKNKVLYDLDLDKKDYAVELVLKDNVKTFVIVKKESVSDKKILNEIEETRGHLNSHLSDTLDFRKTLDDIMLELYDEDRSMYDSLKVFFERLDSISFLLNDHLDMYEDHHIDDLRKLFESLKSKSESSNQ
jgi:hypothetical protein